MRKKIFRLSDLFLLLGFIPTGIFMLNGFRFMETLDASTLFLKPWMMLVLFFLAVVFWSIYLYLEFSRGNIPQMWITVIFIFVLILSLAGIVLQKNPYTIQTLSDGPRHLPPGYDQYATYADGMVSISLPISRAHTQFFLLSVILILLFMYIGFFVFPKRVTTIKPLRFFGYIIFAFVASLMIYSYIAEGSLYGPFLYNLFYTQGPLSGLKSYILNSNAFGMCLLIGTIFCCINHSIEKKWFYFPLMIIFHLQMIFTFCRTGLVVTGFIVVSYMIYSIITTFRGHVVRNIIMSILLANTVLIIISFSFASYLTEGLFIPYLYNALMSFGNTNSLESRFKIWAITIEIMKNNPLSLIVGEGYGTLNYILFHVCLFKNGWDIIPTHNSYLGLLAQGGFSTLLSYAALLVYSIVLLAKNYRKSPALLFAINLGVLAFSLYSIIETIHYLVYGFIFILLVACGALNAKKTI